MRSLDSIKKEFAGLADFVNAFKSESVQLKILDYILQGSSEDTDGEADNKFDKPATKRRPKSPGGKQSAAKAGKSPRKARPGPGTVLDQLLQAGFFNKKRTIADILSHTGAKLGHHFKPNELSTPLIRFIRDNKLDREKNAENQFEYFKK